MIVLVTVEGNLVIDWMDRSVLLYMMVSEHSMTTKPSTSSKEEGILQLVSKSGLYSVRIERLKRLTVLRDRTV